MSKGQNRVSANNSVQDYRTVAIIIKTITGLLFTIELECIQNGLRRWRFEVLNSPNAISRIAFYERDELAII